MIYVGLSSSGRVHGVKIGRKERDRLCGDFDSLLKNGFNPFIKHNEYKVYIYSGTSDKGPSEIGTTSLQRTLVAAPMLIL